MSRIKGLMLSTDNEFSIVNNFSLDSAKKINNILFGLLPILFDNTISEKKAKDIYNVIHHELLSVDTKNIGKLINNKKYRIPFEDEDNIIKNTQTFFLSKKIKSYNIPYINIKLNNKEFNLGIINADLIKQANTDITLLLSKDNNILQRFYTKISNKLTRIFINFYYNYINTGDWTQVISQNVLDIEPDKARSIYHKKIKDKIIKKVSDMLLQINTLRFNFLHCPIYIPKLPIRIINFKVLHSIFTESDVNMDTGAVTYPNSDDYIKVVRYILNTLSILPLSYYNELYCNIIKYGGEYFWREVIDVESNEKPFIGIFGFLNDFRWLIHNDTLPILMNIVHFYKLNKKKAKNLYIYADNEGILIGEK